MNNIRRDPFQAIADPTRREIIGLLARDPMTPNALADRFKTSRQAVAKHVKVLQECGLLSVRREGRERYYRIQPKKLKPIADWIDRYRALWEARFSQLDELLSNLDSKE